MNHSTITKHDDIDTLLRQDAVASREYHIDNIDFSDRVMVQVAEMARSRQQHLAAQTRRRMIVIPVITVVTVVLVMLSQAGSNFLIDAVMDLATNTITPPVVYLFTMLTLAASLGASTIMGDR